MKVNESFGKLLTAAAFRVSLSIGGVLASAALAQADTIVGIFGNPQLKGNLIAADGSLSFLDNTNTAFVSIVNSTSIAPPGGSQPIGSKLQWGANPSSSSLIFFGKTVPSNPLQPFDLGTLTYGNGTSALNSLVFGASLTFYATSNGTVPTSTSGVSSVGIVTTSNLGLAGSEQHDADFVTLSGLANQSFNVLEGQGATAELFGEFVNDPTIQLTKIVLNPGQSGKAFIGNGSPVPVPETSSLLVGMGILGLIGFDWFQRRRRALLV